MPAQRVILFFLLLCFATTANCFHKNINRQRHSITNPQIKYVTIKHYDETYFKTIGEYFGKKQEHQYFRCISRDDENKRTGTYFIIGFNRSIKTFPKNSFINLSVKKRLCDDVQEIKFMIPCVISNFSSEIYCGITSTTINIPDIVAWKVEVKDENGNILMTKHSFLWQ